MSLRGRVATEAISYLIDIIEIATTPERHLAMGAMANEDYDTVSSAEGKGDTELYKKLIRFKIIIIIFSLTAVSSANAAGFFFNWQPFVANTDLALKSPRQEVLIKNLSVADIDMPVSIDARDIFSLTPDQNNYSTPKAEKNPSPGNIKVILFPENTFITTRDKTYANSDDEQVSKIINAITSLIYGDSKIKSLETIGKIIEPQINFYFEF